MTNGPTWMAWAAAFPGTILSGTAPSLVVMFLPFLLFEVQAAAAGGLFMRSRDNISGVASSLVLLNVAVAGLLAGPRVALLIGHGFFYFDGGDGPGGWGGTGTRNAAGGGGVLDLEAELAQEEDFGGADAGEADAELASPPLAVWGVILALFALHSAAVCGGAVRDVLGGRAALWALVPAALMQLWQLAVYPFMDFLTVYLGFALANAVDLVQHVAVLIYYATRGTCADRHAGVDRSWLSAGAAVMHLLSLGPALCYVALVPPSDRTSGALCGTYAAAMGMMMISQALGIAAALRTPPGGAVGGKGGGKGKDGDGDEIDLDDTEEHLDDSAEMRGDEEEGEVGEDGAVVRSTLAALDGEIFAAEEGELQMEHASTDDGGPEADTWGLDDLLNDGVSDSDGAPESEAGWESSETSDSEDGDANSWAYADAVEEDLFDLEEDFLRARPLGKE